MSQRTKETPLARLTLTVTLVEEFGELFWDTETRTQSLKSGADIRPLEFRLAQEGIHALEAFRDKESEG